MPNRSNPRIGLATAAGVIFALLLSEIPLRPWAGQLYRFDVQPLSSDRIHSPTKIVRYYGEGIATSHFSPSRARLTGRAPGASAPWIVIMGDSFVEGLQINDSETMGAVVERLAPPSDPINVRQYSVEHLLLRILEQALPFAACRAQHHRLLLRHTDRGLQLILRKLALLDRTGIGYLYLPLLLAIPLVVGAHCLGRHVGSLAAASEGIRYIRPPHWAMSLYRNCGERLALKPHSAVGYYILLPFPGFVGGFIITLWLLVLYLFSSVNTNPFIYFQF